MGWWTTGKTSQNQQQVQQLSPEATAVQHILGRYLLQRMGQGAPQSFASYLQGGLREPPPLTTSFAEGQVYDPFMISGLKNQVVPYGPTGQITASQNPRVTAKYGPQANADVQGLFNMLFGQQGAGAGGRS